ncbi:uncharacterized protein TNCV_1679031 [Trichonephila clavipes]|nr:uncharacterized protein TNCV_1679031 [Trichonephila clavipes]
MREKSGNRLVPGPDYVVDAFKLSNQAPRVSSESLQTCVAWRCPDGTQHLFCWPILAVSERTKPLDVPTVSEQKLKTTSVSFENIPSKDDKMSGNRIFDVEILRTVFNCLCCPSCLSVNLQLTEDSIFGLSSDVAESGVSVVGTWQRRGHSSLNGCVAVLSIDTGKVLDLEVMSKWCRNCNTSKSSEKSKHIKKHQCSCNHQGSAGSMEPVGAYRLFERSRETRKLQYVEFYGDGDSKKVI